MSFIGFKVIDMKGISGLTISLQILIFKMLLTMPAEGVAAGLMSTDLTPGGK